ncbi:ATP-binding cassette domain-containing protein [Buchnera aphidicola (Periphyllus koelreuteriae)]|uniref:ATP-binding cassette domain-containing protein n=1 Tax=Buchnera aphidicola TaxID=9 RepID=UPI0031B852E9
MKLIILKNIFLKKNNKTILKNISLCIEKNKILTLIGPNGAGKSTLIKIILKLKKQSSGKIIYFKKHRIGYVPQNVDLNIPFRMTVYKFMIMSNLYKKNIIISNLKKVGAEKLKNKYLNNLSAGEIQKVLLARALLNNPNFLVLDEPTQGMDLLGQIKLYKLIYKIKLKLKCSILIVSHDLNFVMNQTDKVICLNKHICCSGTPKLISKNKNFIKMFGSIKIKKFAFYNHNHNHEHNF